MKSVPSPPHARQVGRGSRSERPRRRAATRLTLERLDDRIVPAIIPPTAVPLPYGPLVARQPQPARDLPLPWSLDLIDDEGWVWVDPARKYRDVTGVVRPSVSGSEVNNKDFAALHDSHDQNTHIQVDPYDTVNGNLVSRVNES